MAHLIGGRQGRKDRHKKQAKEQPGDGKKHLRTPFFLPDQGQKSQDSQRNHPPAHSQAVPAPKPVPACLEGTVLHIQEMPGCQKKHRSHPCGHRPQPFCRCSALIVHFRHRSLLPVPSVRQTALSASAPSPRSPSGPGPSSGSAPSACSPAGRYEWSC